MNYKVEILSPDGAVMDEDASYIDAPGTEGRFGILAKHIPMVSSLKEGLISITLANGQKEEMIVSGGILAVHSNKVTVLARTAEKAADIDIQRAQEAAERARQRIQTKEQDMDLLRAEASLRRALMRLKVAKKR